MRGLSFSDGGDIPRKVKNNTIEDNSIRIMSIHDRDVANGIDGPDNLIRILVNLVEETENVFLIDSGASISILSKRTFEMAKDLGLKYKHIARKTKISTISGGTINYSSVAEINFSINGRKFKHAFFITNQIDYEKLYQGLLGLDFLRAFDCAINVTPNTLRIGNQEIEFYDPDRGDTQNEKIQNVRIARKIDLEPGESREVLIKGDSGKITENRLIPKKLKIDHLAVNTKVQVKGGKNYVKIQNNSKNKITLNKRTVVGHIQIKETGSSNNEKNKERINTVIDIRERRIQDFNIEDFKFDELPRNENLKFKDLVNQYKDVFSKSFLTIGETKILEPHIELHHTTPISQKPLPIPFRLKERVKQELDSLAEAGIIRKSNSMYASPMVVVHKKEADKLRLVCDFRLLNRIAISDTYPLPRIFEILNSLSGAKFFAKMDLHAAFHQIVIPPKLRHLFGFSSELGFWEYTRLPFGYKNSSNIFQRMMDMVFGDLKEKKIITYVDDIIIGAQSIDELYEKLEIVFQRLRENNLTISPSKCVFGATKIDFLGYRVSESELSPTEDNARKILEFNIPNTIKKVKSFLGTCNFYRSLIPKYAELAKPLTDLTCKGVRFQPNDATYIHNFKRLQNAFFNPPLLRQPDFERPFVITTDASKIAISGVLEQWDATSQMFHPIAYYSRALNPAETRYAPIKLELMAVHNSVTYFKGYVYGSKFEVRSDAEPLKEFKNRHNPGNLVTRWLLELADYDFEIEHIKGVDNHLADYISRDPLVRREEPHNDRENIDHVGRTRGTDQSEDSQKFAKRTLINSVSLDSQEYKKQQLAEVMNILADMELANEKQSDDDEEIEVVNVIKATLFEDRLSLANIKELQDDDFVIKLIKDAIIEGEILNVPNFQNYSLNSDNGLLMYRTEKNLTQDRYFNQPKIVVPTILQKEVLERVHSAHYGQLKTFNLVRKHFYWTGYFKDVENFVESCWECMKLKGKIPRQALAEMPICTKNGEILSLDICGPFIQTPKGNKFVLTIIDQFSRFVQFYPLKTVSAEEVADKLIHYISIFGAPREVLTDNGGAFIAHLQRRVQEVFGIKPTFTSNYHPQTNAKCERVHKQLKNCIKARCKDNNQWEDYVYLHAALYNANHHKSVGESPDFVMFGVDKAKLINYSMKESDNGRLRSYTENRVRNVVENYKKVYENLAMAQKKMCEKSQYKAKVRNIEVGSRVFIKEGRTSFGKSKFIGPYRVLQQVNKYVFRLQDIEFPNKPIIKVNIDRIFQIKDRKKYLSDIEQIDRRLEDDLGQLETMNQNIQKINNPQIIFSYGNQRVIEPVESQRSENNLNIDEASSCDEIPDNTDHLGQNGTDENTEEGEVIDSNTMVQNLDTIPKVSDQSNSGYFLRSRGQNNEVNATIPKQLAVDETNRYNLRSRINKTEMQNQTGITSQLN